LNFYFVTRVAASLQAAGFDAPELCRPNAGVHLIVAGPLQRMDDTRQRRLMSSLGEAGYRVFRDWANAWYEGLAEGRIHQVHFRAGNRS